MIVEKGRGSKAMLEAVGIILMIMVGTPLMALAIAISHHMENRRNMEEQARRKRLYSRRKNMLIRRYQEQQQAMYR